MASAVHCRSAPLNLGRSQVSQLSVVTVLEGEAGRLSVKQARASSGKALNLEVEDAGLMQSGTKRDNIIYPTLVITLQ